MIDDDASSERKTSKRISSDEEADISDGPDFIGKAQAPKVFEGEYISMSAKKHVHASPINIDTPAKPPIEKTPDKLAKIDTIKMRNGDFFNPSVEDLPNPLLTEENEEAPEELKETI